MVDQDKIGRAAPQWDDFKTVLYLLRHGTLGGAAVALGLNYTTVARRISRLEIALGVTLFERLADGYLPTEAGKLVARYADRMEAAEDSLLRKIPGIADSLTGSLVITAPQLLIGPHLSKVIDRFCERHPDVDLYVRAGYELLDLNRREADLAIRISASPGDTLTGVRLAAQETASFAAENWAARLRDAPDTPVEWLVFSATKDGPVSPLKMVGNGRIRMRFDDMAAMIGAAQAGLGVVRMPMFLGRATHGLVQVPAMTPKPYADIWVVGHPDVWRSAKVTAFRNILVPYFKANRGVFVAGED